MKKTYVATFYKHYGAMRFLKMNKEKGYKGRMAPVPRSLSSSCGVCVFFAGEPEADFNQSTDLERILEWDES